MKKDKTNFEYMLEFNKMIEKIEQEGYIYNYNETTGDVEFYDAEKWLKRDIKNISFFIAFL